MYARQLEGGEREGERWSLSCNTGDLSRMLMLRNEGGGGYPIFIIVCSGHDLTSVQTGAGPASKIPCCVLCVSGNKQKQQQKEPARETHLNMK